jgi:hypothetical protein
VRGYANQVREYLKEAGCYFVRHGKGDHDIWFSPITNRGITVDRHIDSRHTANGIPKEARIGKKFWSNECSRDRMPGDARRSFSARADPNVSMSRQGIRQPNTAFALPNLQLRVPEESR